MNTTETQRLKYSRYLAVYFLIIGTLLALFSLGIYWWRQPTNRGDIALLVVFGLIGVFYVIRGYKLHKKCSAL